MKLAKAILFCGAFGALVACGADGEPVEPSVSANVTVTPSGVNVGAGVGLHQGPLSIFLGL